MKKIACILLLSCYSCNHVSEQAKAQQQTDSAAIAVPDENTLEGQAHRLLSASFPKTAYESFSFGAVHIGVRQNMPAVYKAMEAQGLCRVEEKTVSRYPLCVLHLTPKALQYMQQNSQDSTPSRLEGMVYKAKFKLFDVVFTGIVDVSEIPAFNATNIRYGIKRTNLTPFNEAYLFDSGKKVFDESRIEDTLTNAMQKTSKGWRLMKR